MEVIASIDLSRGQSPRDVIRVQVHRDISGYQPQRGRAAGGAPYADTAEAAARGGAR